MNDRHRAARLRAASAPRRERPQITPRDNLGRARIIPTGHPIPLPGFVPTGKPLFPTLGIGC